jgi:hypothetical protein
MVFEKRDAPFRNVQATESTNPASDEHRKIEHGYCRTTYREQGATRTVELAMLTRLEHAASFAVGFSRHTDHFEAFFSTEMVKSYERVVKMAQREIVKLSAHDAFAIEQQHEARRIAEEMKRKQSVQPRRTVANERYVQQAVEEEQERKRTRGRGM